MSYKKTLRLSLFFLLACLCVACGVRSPKSQYYVLTAPRQAQNTENTDNSTDKAHIIVGPIVIPRYLDQSSMVFVDQGSAQITLSELDIWAEPIAEGFEQVLNEAINQNSKHVNALPDRIPVKPKAYLRVAINKFDGNLNDTCTLDAQWLLLDINGNILHEARFVQHRQSGNSPNSMVETLSSLVMDFGASLAPLLDKHFDN